MSATISSAGLVLSIAPFMVHGVEVFFPMLSRWVVNFVFPAFSLELPSWTFTYADQITMLDAAIDAMPTKQREAKDYIFLLLFEQRQSSAAFAGVATAAVYGLVLPVAERNLLHLELGIMASLMCLANLNHVGIGGILTGHHPMVSFNGKMVGVVFTPFWAAAAVLNFYAFSRVF